MTNEVFGSKDTQGGRTEHFAAAGPRGFPLVGALPQLSLNPIEFLTTAARQYGGIYKLPMGFADAYVLSHPEYVQHIVQERSSSFVKGRLWDPLRALLGNGVGVSDGSFWLRQRRMMQPQFHASRLGAMASMLSNTIADGLTRWRPFVASHAPIDLVQEMGKIALTACTKALLGEDLATQDASEICRSVHGALDTMFLPLITHWMPPWLPVPGANRFKESLRSIDRVVYGIIAQRRRATTLGDDLLSTLLIGRDVDGGQLMTDQQLRDEVVTMFLASYEPVVTTLAWTWVLLSRNPSVARSLRQEVRQVIGGRLPTFDDLRQLTYSRSVLQEALRLYPPVWLLIREAAEEDVVGGVRIPAGATTLGFTYGIHHDARIWPDPEAFDPARFSRESTAESRRFTYMPFGAGPHKCIGESYAMMEAQLFLTILLQQYQVRLIPGQHIRPRATFTLRPGGPVLAMLQPA